ncbi:MAG: spore coat protein [Clostridia bacterium]|jgi:rubrerythrin|nr:spore coat protein [Clostridia bacterium]
MQWTQKESMLLQDMMNSEQICIDKYTDYADRACDEELRTLFESIKTTEEEHLKTLEQMQSGTIPAMNAQSGSQKQQDSSSGSGGSKKQSKACEEDEYLCRDALDTEKHVSSLYDTCIFEFVSQQARDVLNHIQKEEQEHGKKIYDYMASHGMTA